jgi:outer membrane immunogenic protein
MKKFALIALAAAFATSPAYAAGEGRIEARGGIAWSGGDSEAIAGVAAGYDFDLGDSAFAGVEGSADKLLAGGTDVLFGVSGRVGAKVGGAGRAYVLAGYSFGDGDAAHVAAGYQHNFGNKLYGKIEYRRFLLDGADINTAGVGLGVKF